MSVTVIVVLIIILMIMGVINYAFVRNKSAYYSQGPTNLIAPSSDGKAPVRKRVNR